MFTILEVMFAISDLVGLTTVGLASIICSTAAKSEHHAVLDTWLEDGERARHFKFDQGSSRWRWGKGEAQASIWYFK